MKRCDNTIWLRPDCMLSEKIRFDIALLSPIFLVLWANISLLYTSEINLLNTLESTPCNLGFHAMKKKLEFYFWLQF